MAKLQFTIYFIYNLQLFLLTLHKVQDGKVKENVAKGKRESDLQKIIKSSQKTTDRIKKKTHARRTSMKKKEKKSFRSFIS